MLPDMIDRTKTVYKGDVLASSFYLFVGVISVTIAVLLHFVTVRLGFYYLSVGMAIFAVYMLGKAAVMMYVYWSRYQYYKDRTDITNAEVDDEKDYTSFRIRKKNKNRRYYMYIILLGCLVAFAGVFQQEKGMIIATCIPIVLLSGIEFGVGLLTEFRLSEYLRQLNR